MYVNTYIHSANVRNYIKEQHNNFISMNKTQLVTFFTKYQNKGNGKMNLYIKLEMYHILMVVISRGRL